MKAATNFMWVVVAIVGLTMALTIAGCDEPSRQERFTNEVSSFGTPEDATNIVILDEHWYTFEWRGQCFLAMNRWRHSAVTKIDCE